MRGKGAQGYYWVSCHVVRIFCEVMSHSAINRSVDKVRCPRGKYLFFPPKEFSFTHLSILSLSELALIILMTLFLGGFLAVF